MASVTLKRGTKLEVEATPIQDGQLLMETDQLNNNKIYMDLPSGERVPVGGSGAWIGTQAELEQAITEGTIADGTQVIVTDDYSNGIPATTVSYANLQSELSSTNVQGAIDEVAVKVKEISKGVGMELTQAEYNALTEEEKKNGTEYFITDAVGLTASNIPYKNTNVGAELTKIDSDIDSLNSTMLNRETLSISSVISAKSGLTITSESRLYKIRNRVYGTIYITGSFEVNAQARSLNICSIANGYKPITEVFSNGQSFVGGLYRPSILNIESDGSCHLVTTAASASGSGMYFMVDYEIV